MSEIRYGANGMPMPVKEEAPVVETPKPKKKKKVEPLQEILEVNPNDEDLSSEWEKEENDEKL